MERRLHHARGLRRAAHLHLDLGAVDHPAVPDHHLAVRVGCDAGVVYAPAGPYAVAILSRGVPSESRTDLALSEISLAIYGELGA